MKKEVKDTIIAELGQKLQEFPHFYLVDVTGLNAEKTSALRRKCFQSEIKMVVVKNSLLHKAFEASDIDFSELYDCLKGTTAVLFANTANVPAKLLKEYDKEDVPTLKAAYAEESFYVGADKLAELSASRARTKLSQRLLLCSSHLQRTLFQLFNQEATLFMVCLRHWASVLSNQSQCYH